MDDDLLCRAWNDEHLCGLPTGHSGDHRCCRVNGCHDVWQPYPADLQDEDEWEGTSFARPYSAHEVGL